MYVAVAVVGSLVGQLVDWLLSVVDPPPACKSHAPTLHRCAAQTVLWPAGANVWGQLGSGNQTPSNKFVPVKGLPADVVALQAGGSTSGAICDSGRVYVWGRNDWGMLGLGNTNSRWKPTLIKGLVAVHPGTSMVCVSTCACAADVPYTCVSQHPRQSH